MTPFVEMQARMIVIFRVTSTARDAEVPKPSLNVYSTEAYEVDFSDHIEYLKKISFNDAGKGSKSQI